MYSQKDDKELTYTGFMLFMKLKYRKFQRVWKIYLLIHFVHAGNF